MKVSNFKLVTVEGKSLSDWKYTWATVDVTTWGFPFLKKTVESKVVFKEWESIYWCFADTGKYIIESSIDNLERQLKEPEEAKERKLEATEYMKKRGVSCGVTLNISASIVE